MNWNKLLPYSPAIIALLQGVVKTSNKNKWDVLKKYENEISDFFESIGIQLIVREENGYAYLNQPDNLELSYEDKQIIKEKTGFVQLDRLITRKPLNDEQALLCVLLREQLEENENITKFEIKVLLKNFYTEDLNQEKQSKDIDTIINRLSDFNFLTVLKEDREDDRNMVYKIEKILKDKINLNKIEEIKQKFTEKFYA